MVLAFRAENPHKAPYYDRMSHIYKRIMRYFWKTIGPGVYFRYIVENQKENILI